MPLLGKAAPVEKACGSLAESAPAAMNVALPGAAEK
ncbi:MAG: hypothetical protein ACI82N_001441 [Maricaulis sp.]|jgi:hypothetical protein